MQRSSAPKRMREEFRALMNGDLGTADGRSDLVRLALRLIVEEALEGEVSDALGRERYERSEGDKAGYRNGYRTGKVKTAEGRAPNPGQCHLYDLGYEDFGESVDIPARDFPAKLQGHWPWRLGGPATGLDGEVGRVFRLRSGAC